MSKERLEDMENNAMFDGTIRYVDGERIVDNYARIRQEDYEWLIEQAERAQELESQRKEDLHDFVNRIVKQNKRYRDVIEIAIHNMKGCSDLGTVFALNELERVLEGAE